VDWWSSGNNDAATQSLLYEVPISASVLLNMHRFYLRTSVFGPEKKRSLSVKLYLHRHAHPKAPFASDNGNKETEE